MARLQGESVTQGGAWDLPMAMLRYMSHRKQFVIFRRVLSQVILCCQSLWDANVLCRLT